MPIYVYETLPDPGKRAVRRKRYEIWQHMRDATLEVHPETGERIRRIMIGGIGMPGSISDPKADLPGGPSMRPPGV